MLSKFFCIFLLFGLPAVLIEVALGQDEGAFVTIYAGRNYQGKQRDIFIPNNSCFVLFGDWAREVQSLKFPENSCIQLYDGLECDGNSKILRGRFKVDRDQGMNLALVNFERKVHSVHLC